VRFADHPKTDQSDVQRFFHRRSFRFQSLTPIFAPTSNRAFAFRRQANATSAARLIRLPAPKNASVERATEPFGAKKKSFDNLPKLFL
jgi:hypothetical protein